MHAWADPRHLGRHHGYQQVTAYVQDPEVAARASEEPRPTRPDSYHQRMPRWEPNSAERLAAAAVELFLECGYDAVTSTQIAERAGLNRRSFFRHFRHKREILFSGYDRQCDLFAEAIGSAPPGATPLEAVIVGMRIFCSEFGDERRGFAAQRQRVIDASPDLQERDLLKRAQLTTAIADALGQRGVERRTAAVTAVLAAVAISGAFVRWCEPSEQRTLTALAEQDLREVTVAAARLG